MTGEPGVVYKPIPNRKGHYAGSDGSVWSVVGGGSRKRKPTRMANGYLCLAFRVSGKPIPVLVHRLILETFVGNCPPGMECCHNNGNPADNRVENLRWDTHQANMDDSVRHGTRAKMCGETNASAVLTEAVVREVVRLLASGVKQRVIARQLNIGYRSVNAIAIGRTWTHITGLTRRIDRGRLRKTKESLA